MKAKKVQGEQCSARYEFKRSNVNYAVSFKTCRSGGVRSVRKLYPALTHMFSITRRHPVHHSSASRIGVSAAAAARQRWGTADAAIHCTYRPMWCRRRLNNAITETSCIAMLSVRRQPAITNCCSALAKFCWQSISTPLPRRQQCIPTLGWSGLYNCLLQPARWFVRAVCTCRRYYANSRLSVWWNSLRAAWRQEIEIMECW